MPKVLLSKTIHIKVGDGFMPDGKTPRIYTQPRLPGQVVDLDEATAQAAIAAGAGELYTSSAPPPPLERPQPSVTVEAEPASRKRKS